MAAASSNNNGPIANVDTDEFIKKSRVTRAAPPKPAYDPLQFVQIRPAKLYDLNKAKPSNERKLLEVKAHREVEDAEEWQCNLDNWKSSRRKRVEHIIDKITEAKKIEQEEVCRGRKKSKTFSEMLENSGSKRRFILPENEDDDEIGSYSDDLQDPGDPSKPSYKDESTDDRGTDDTSSCCSSKLADGDLKTPDPDDAREAPEMNEFSLAIENYKSKFPMTQNRALGMTTTISATNAFNTPSSVVSSMEDGCNDNYESSSAAEEEPAPPAVEDVTQKMSSLAVEHEEKQYAPADESSEEHRTSRDEDAPNAARPEGTPKVNVIERRRLFEQLQQVSSSADAGSKPASGSASVDPCAEDSPTSSSEEPNSSAAATEWFAAGSIKERRAMFERYQSNEAAVADDPEQHVGSRSSRSSSSSVAVTKSRSESNVGFVNGSTGRFELALNQLKRNGADYGEDSGIQSTTDLSRSSVVSHPDDHDPSMMLLLPDEVAGKSPARSTTLDSASEFSDTDCSNGQLLDNALDVAFEELDSELNESGNVDDQTEPEDDRGQPAPVATEIVPLSVVDLAPEYIPAEDEFSLQQQVVLMSLPKSTLTPPKEKPPPPPEDDEPEPELQSLSTGTVITSWMEKHAANGTGNGNGNVDVTPSELYEQHVKRMGDKNNGHGLRQEDLVRLADEQWRSLESYEVVQQVQHQRQQKQQEPEKDQERDKDQQELLVYSNRIETMPPHHQLYDPGEHEEMVSVERELLQIEQEELQRRREKQMFYEKLTKADTARQTEHHQQQQHQQQSHPAPHQRHPPPQQQPYYYAHHHSHQPHHHLHHHRASMPAMDSRSLQNVNSYATFETPFLDDAVNSYEMGSLHRESMPNLSNVAASSSHPSSLSSYGEEYSTNSGTSFDGGCWPPSDPRPPGPGMLFDKRPTVAPRPTMNGFLPPGVVGFPSPNGGPRLSNSVFEQHPKDNKQSALHPAMGNRGQAGNGANNNMPYGQHWLVQEAEQRRIEQHQKSASNNAKRPLPKFVIDAITQRVQKLNAGSPENSDRSNLSEDSDLAMLSSMKHHHHHQSQSFPAHHHQQQAQQKYSNASDKVLSVSGKKECSHCRIELGKGAAMAIESLGLFYHIECFKCCVCHVKLGDGTNGIDVRVRKYRLHCQNCFSSEDGVKFSCV